MISFDGGYLRQYQTLFAAPGADHVQRRFTAGPVERAAQALPIDGHHTLALRRKLRHKLLKAHAKLIRIKIAKQPAKGVMAGKTPFQLEKAAQK